MDRVDKLKVTEETLKEIINICKNGFRYVGMKYNEVDVIAIETKAKMLLKIIED